MKTYKALSAGYGLSLLVCGEDASGRQVEDRLQWEEAGGKRTKRDKPFQYTGQKKREA